MLIRTRFIYIFFLFLCLMAGNPSFHENFKNKHYIFIYAFVFRATTRHYKIMIPGSPHKSFQNKDFILKLPSLRFLLYLSTIFHLFFVILINFVFVLFLVFFYIYFFKFLMRISFVIKTAIYNIPVYERSTTKFQHKRVNA